MSNGMPMQDALSHAPQPAPALLPPRESLRRYLALWFPFLPTDRLRRSRQSQKAGVPADQPFALIEKSAGALRLAALDEAATRAGLSPGMGLADARALVPGLAAADMDRDADARLLMACAEACERFSPLVALDHEDGLILDITGCVPFFASEEDIRFRTLALMSRFSLKSRAAVAGTPDAARAFARFSPGGILPAGVEEEQGRCLPITALDCEAATLTALSRAGLRTLGDLADRPSAALTARFGGDLALRLRRILGVEDVRITPLRPLPEIMAERSFSEPLTAAGAMMEALTRLAAGIVASLERRQEGLRALEASFFRSDGVVRRVVVETAQAVCDVASLMRLLRLRLDHLADPLDPGFGFDALRLAVLRSDSVAARQKDLSGGETGGEEGAAGLVDRLIARFGRHAVVSLARRDTHDPTRAGAALPWHQEKWRQEKSAVENNRVGTGEPPARPLTLFEPPHPIEVIAEIPDGPPFRFRWRRLLHEVAHAEGPERIAPEWWRENEHFAITRDYYRVENALGQRFWLFREGLYNEAGERPRWFLHGLFA